MIEIKNIKNQTSRIHNLLSNLRLDAKQLRASKPRQSDIKKIKRQPIYIVCDNVLDTYNIGSIFRLADAVAASGVYLCGGSETPPNSRIAKASVGCDKWVPWQYFATAAEAISKLKTQNSKLKVIAIEQHSKAVDYRSLNYEQLTMNHKRPVVFVVGHETDGVSKEVLKMADKIVEIPMFGVNISLNVMVSLAIVLFRAI
ncbi:MAG: tRNA/rRNA methyltransferase [Candidatus Curtissbacteria bacterium GW2011_GWA1_40_16]|uniref:tRNA/rRNA methyltransferase n=1 Tax=Candidatus Curtissbacteria bacterium GW2011_GWA1_40_16 TaxID=1618405 RepID=A0A0G0RBU6_9BACT|nr:MAG: tRNA/rRNA methyltransferase [Candidatus Curtissbacteria bacterium GW2011_GWA1_40_16]